MDKDNKTEISQSRPKSNWAQLISAVTSIATVIIAIYAIFFSSTSQALVQYLQSELSLRNQRISLLETTKDKLEKDIIKKEEDISKLDEKSKLLQNIIASLDIRKESIETLITSLRNEQNVLSQQVYEARLDSANNEFQYVREKIASHGDTVFVVTWPLTIGENETRKNVRRETLWPQYLNFYRESVKKLPANEQALGNRIVSLFEQRCIRFKNIVFNIPVHIPRTSPNFERLDDPRITAVRNRAVKTMDEIRQCLRSIKND